MTDERSPLGRSYQKLFGASTISNLGDGIGQIAYPWLASAVTRNPLLVALVTVFQRLPWLLFSLPAGVVTDRYERRMLMVGANVARAILTVAVAVMVLGQQDSLPSPAQLDDASTVVPTNVMLYLVVLAATLFLGTAEVLYDNTAQTIMPSLVQESQLEKANGRLWSVEQVANTVAGPAAGAALLAFAFAAPFFVDAVTFALSALLIYLLPRPAKPIAAPAARKPWRGELREGFSWLWQHDLLRPLAITLGLLNGLGTVSAATFVLFAQEVLLTSPTEFAILSTGGAVGGVIGGWTASAVSQRLGAGPSLWLTLVLSGLTSIAIGLSSRWPVVWLMFMIFIFGGVLWNVITVSLRQSIIPDELLGRVNSVYRFFAWGSIPIGALVGGLIILVGETFWSREFALRLPYLVSGVLTLALLYLGTRFLTTEKIEAARSAANAAIGWQALSLQDREREYSPSSCVGGDISEFIDAYIDRSRDGYEQLERDGHAAVEVRYGDLATQTIDLVVPADGPASHPVVVYLHGGYWQELTKRESFFAASDHFGNGIAFAAVDYTLAPAATLAEIVMECRTAVQTIRDRAGEFNLDPDRIFVAGSSAGAHLAAMIGLGLDDGWRPAGLGLVSGIYDLEPLVETYINDAVGLDQIEARSLSPQLQPLEGFPATVIVVGSNETREFKRQSSEMARSIEAAGSPVSSHEIAGRNHFDVVLDLGDPTTELGQAMLGLIRV